MQEEVDGAVHIHTGGDRPLFALSKCYKLLGNQELADEYAIKANEWNQ